MDLPLILAGPLLRRVEPDLVTVWLALNKEATVSLVLFEGLSAPSEVPLATSAPASTVRIGDGLHLVTVAFKLASIPRLRLRPGLVYSYDLLLHTKELVQGRQDHSLGSQGLLANDPVGGHPHLALGYAPGLLPSFALPPDKLTDLRLVHGSCRILDYDGPDGLAWVDDLIEDARRGSSFAQQRPHQLFMTGDQIYADDVAMLLLFMLNTLGAQLLSTVEELPVAGKSYPADLRHFPMPHRTALILDEAKMTSTACGSHLLSLGEFCAMYLMVWSPACWPAPFPDCKEFLPPYSWLDPNDPGAAMPKVLQEAYFSLEKGDKDKRPIREDDKDRIKGRENAYKNNVRLMKEVLRTLPKVRRALANVPTYMMFDDHEVTDDWYLNPIWRDRVLTSPLGRTIVRNAMVAYSLFQDWGNDPVRYESGNHKLLLEQAQKLSPQLPAVQRPARFTGRERGG